MIDSAVGDLQVGTLIVNRGLLPGSIDELDDVSIIRGRRSLDTTMPRIAGVRRDVSPLYCIGSGAEHRGQDGLPKVTEAIVLGHEVGSKQPKRMAGGDRMEQREITLRSESLDGQSRYLIQ